MYYKLSREPYIDLKMKYSDTGNTVVVTATFFCHLAKTAIHVLVKKALVIPSPVKTAIMF